MRLSTFVVGALLGASLSPLALGQTGNAAPDAAVVQDEAKSVKKSRARLRKALQQTAATSDTAFEARWGPADGKLPKDGFQRMLAQRQSGKATGSWHPDLSTCAIAGKDGDEIIRAGRRTIVRSADLAWQRRAGRFADGNPIPHVPDIELLVDLLAGWDLATIHRETGSLDDRPVETLTATLNEDQLKEAIWSGALPESLATSSIGVNLFRIAAGGAGRAGAKRTAAPLPAATVDIAIAIDPATALVQQIRCRSYIDQNVRMGGGGAGVAVFVGGAAAADPEDEEDDDEEEVDPDAPMQFDNGLPRRPRKGKIVNDFVVTLKDHGQRTAPELTAEQRQLLKR